MNDPRARRCFALIGISGYGRVHLELARGCRDRGEADIVAAVVINAAEEAENVAELKAMGTVIYTDYEEMLRDHAGRLDLCLIPTGIHWHVRMTLAAMRAGANVLVEKPLAGSIAEIAAVQELERASGKFVAVGFQDCYDPGTLWLVDELRRGAIGVVTAVRFLGVWPRPRAYFQRNNWAGRLRVGGVQVLDSPLNNAFGHFVMLSLLFSGAKPEEIEPAAGGVELFRAHAIESFDTGVVALRSSRGVRLWFGASHASQAAIEPEIMIEGTAGTAGWQYEHEAWFQDPVGRRQSRPVLDQHATRRLMMTAVQNRMNDDRFPICSTTMAERHTALIEGVHRAAAIQSFPPSMVTWNGENGSSAAIPTVQGLDAALRQAFAGQRSLRDSGFSLARGPNGG